MKINSGYINKAYTGQTAAKEESRKGQKIGGGVNNGHTDKIVMSSSAVQAQLVAKASKAITEEVNGQYGNERLDVLRASIENDTYQVSDEALAEALMDKMSMIGAK